MNLQSIGNRSKRRAVFVALIFISAVAAQTGFVPSLFSASPMIMVPLCVIIALYEKSIPGMVFGILCGALWDLMSATPDGFYTVLLATAGFVVGSLSSFFLRTNLLSALLLTFLVSGTCGLFHWGLFFVIKGYDGTFSVLFSHYLSSVAYTLLFGAVFYPVISYIVKHTAEKKKYI